MLPTLATALLLTLASIPALPLVQNLYPLLFSLFLLFFQANTIISLIYNKISYWNLVPQSRYWLISNYGGAIQPGQKATAGFILFVNTTDEASIPDLVLTVYGTNCDAECVASFPTEAPTASPSDAPTGAPEPTNAPSDAPTDAPTNTPTNTPSDAPVECNIIATVSKTNEWEQDGLPTATYSLTLFNAGSTSLVDYVTGFGYYPGTLIQTWNLEPARGGYKVINFGDVLLPGASFSGAGFIISNATEVLVQPYGSNCV